MTTSDLAPHNNQDHLPFLPENETEVARLLVQRRRLIELLGGILPKSLDLSNIHRILDIACGPGGWSFEMARKHPAMQIIGIDQSAYFIQQARAMASSQQLSNVTFMVQNLPHLEGDNFTPASFDLINMSLTVGKIAPREFPPLLQSLVHLCRPGGLLHWLEAELPITNSPAYQRLMAIVLQSLKVTRRAYSPGSSSLGITACMVAWFRKAGCRIVQDTAHTFDISAGTPTHSIFLRQSWLFANQLQPFLLATGVITFAEFEELFHRTQKELSAPTFCGICLLREVVAMKLHEGEHLDLFR